MTDHFQTKAADWDQRETVRLLSQGIGNTMQAKLELLPDMQVMDFGAGTGLISGQLAPHVAQIAAVDTSQAMLAQLAQKSALQGKVVGYCVDLLDEPLGLSFDAIVSAMALHHVQDTQAILDSFFAHLKPGGQLALADLDHEDGSFHPEHTEGVFHEGFVRQELHDKLLKSGFEHVEWVTAHTVHKNGKDYPVFVVTAKKP